MAHYFQKVFYALDVTDHPCCCHSCGFFCLTRTRSLRQERKHQHQYQPQHQRHAALGSNACQHRTVGHHHHAGHQRQRRFGYFVSASVRDALPGDAVQRHFNDQISQAQAIKLTAWSLV